MSADLVQDLVDIAAATAEAATRAGADAAEVIVRDGSELTAKVRLGEPELVKEATSRALGLRLFVDRRAALTYTSDFTPAAMAAFVRDSVALARLAEPDELNFLPDADDLAREVPDLDLWDESSLGVDAATALAWAVAGEAAARKADPRVTNSEGATWSRTAGAVAFANSGGFAGATGGGIAGATGGGFAGGYRGTYQSFYVEPVCDDAGGKKRNGYWWTANRFLAALDDPERVGLEAARRTVAKLGARKAETCQVPVVFDPEAGRGLLGALFGVAAGSSWFRKSSYLIGREGQACASPLVTVVDDPLIPRGPGSKPFDGDGVRARKNLLVEAGILRTVLCDTYSARKLGRKSTGSAGRGVGGAPGPTTSNFIMLAGTTPAAEVVRSVERGLYVTEMMGFGFNPVTGDFSRGAAGFWIEKGERAFPVSEVTISANFDDLWKGVDSVGDDLDRRSSTACPTFRVARMTVAGR
jgi:PmbA protein